MAAFSAGVASLRDVTFCTLHRLTLRNPRPPGLPLGCVRTRSRVSSCFWCNLDPSLAPQTQIHPQGGSIPNGGPAEASLEWSLKATLPRGGSRLSLPGSPQMGLLVAVCPPPPFREPPQGSEQGHEATSAASARASPEMTSQRHVMTSPPQTSALLVPPLETSSAVSPSGQGVGCPTLLV